MPVKFIRGYSIYSVGDVAAFDAETANRLVASGIAVLHVVNSMPLREPVAAKMAKK